MFIINNQIHNIVEFEPNLSIVFLSDLFLLYYIINLDLWYKHKIISVCINYSFNS